MTARFAALETRVSAAVLTHLANATADLNGEAVDGMFEAVYSEAFGMVAGVASVFRLASSVAVADGDTLVVKAIPYTVVGIEPDGHGITLLRLEKQ